MTKLTKKERLYHEGIIAALTGAVYGTKHANLDHEQAAKHFPSKNGFRTATGWAYECLALIEHHKNILEQA